jgi:hypothetical protein
LNRTTGVAPLAIFSASVAPYGTAAVARGIVGKVDGSLSADKISALSAIIESLLVNKQAPTIATRGGAARALSKYEAQPKTDIRNFVRSFVDVARMKRNVNGYTFADPITNKEIELRFFLAGGGADSGWYRTTILSLDPRDNQAFYGVKKVRLETVKPSTGFRGGDFPRFVIALGLTNSPDYLEEVSQCLPSRIKKKPPLPQREAARPITKDDM